MHPQKMIYETISIVPNDIPVQIFEQTRDSDSKGAFLHWHEQIEIYYVVQGGLSLLCNGKQEWLYPGDIGFVNWCEPHRGTAFLDNTIFFTIQIDLALLDSSLLEQDNHFSLTQYNKVPSYIHLHPHLGELIEALIHEYVQPDHASIYMIRSILYNIFATLIRLQKTRPDDSPAPIPASFKTVRQLLKYITLNYHQEMSLALLAHHFGLSKSYMSHTFKEHTGQTVHQYINDHRCQQAATLILSKTPLSDVYQSVGFNDYNYFSRVFKKTYGVSPKHYSTS